MKTNWGTGTDIARGVTIALAILLAGAALPALAAEGYNLYKPEKVQSRKIPLPGEGVLTRTVTIQQGDTLKKLSARYCGKRSYFPQILLFNRIKDPDLIHAGAQLQVPLSSLAGEAAPRIKKAAREKHDVHKSVSRHEKRAPAASGRTQARLFRRGMGAFSSGHYRRAIEIFDEYLATYPNSRNAADAALYRAECYEKLTGG